MALVFTTRYLEDALAVFSQYKKMAEGALAQINDEEFFHAIDAESNSAALIVKHLSGNMLSRWTDFLTSDGEKPWRDRDSEFENRNDCSRAQLMARWESGWELLFKTLESMNEADLACAVAIRGEKHSALQAINRQVAHYCSHVGQIVFLCKHLRSAEWKTLSIARNKSGEFNRRLERGEASQR